MLERAAQRVSGLKICQTFNQPHYLSGTLTCESCNYSLDTHLIRDLVAEVQRREQELQMWLTASERYRRRAEKAEAKLAALPDFTPLREAIKAEAAWKAEIPLHRSDRSWWNYYEAAIAEAARAYCAAFPPVDPVGKE